MIHMHPASLQIRKRDAILGNLSSPKLFKIAVVLFAIMFCRQSHAEIKNSHVVNWDPGRYMGLSLQIGTAGTIYIPQKTQENTSTAKPQATHDSMGTVPGLELFFEKLTQNGVVAPSFSLRMRFHQFKYNENEDFRLHTEFQLDPGIRFYFAKNGTFRPYLRLTAGFSFGRRYGTGINSSGFLGVLFKKTKSKVAIFADAGIEGVLFINTDQNTRQLLFSWGLAF